MSSPPPPPPTVAIFLFAVTVSLLVGVTIYDLLALASTGPGHSVSYAMWYYGYRYPQLYLLLGLAVGHILLPLVLPSSWPPPPANGQH